MFPTEILPEKAEMIRRRGLCFDQFSDLTRQGLSQIAADKPQVRLKRPVNRFKWRQVYEFSPLPQGIPATSSRIPARSVATMRQPQANACNDHQGQSFKKRR